MIAKKERKTEKKIASLAKSTEMDNGGGVDMSALPEGCVANVMSFTSPRDACRLAVVSSLFRSAAESDIVWERFLPPDHESIIAKSPQSSSLLASPSKKQVYVTLCNNPILIDNGEKSFWLDKWSGKKCYMLSARDLIILGCRCATYWRWTSDSTSRFEEVAELLQAPLALRMSGMIDADMLSPSTLYAAYIVFKLTGNSHRLDHAPTEFAVGFFGRESSKRMAYFQPENLRRRRQGRRVLGRGRRFGLLNDSLDSSATAESNAARRDAKERGDGWLEIELGEIFCKERELGMLKMSVEQEAGDDRKSGLIVGGMEIRPKHGEVRP